MLITYIGNARNWINRILLNTLFVLIFKIYTGNILNHHFILLLNRISLFEKDFKCDLRRNLLLLLFLIA